MAAAGAPLRFIQEWMGHRDYKTTSIYADCAPDPSQGARYAARAFVREDVAPEAMKAEAPANVAPAAPTTRPGSSH